VHLRVHVGAVRGAVLELSLRRDGRGDCVRNPPASTARPRARPCSQRSRPRPTVGTSSTTRARRSGGSRRARSRTGCCTACTALAGCAPAAAARARAGTRPSVHCGTGGTKQYLECRRPVHTFVSVSISAEENDGEWAELTIPSAVCEIKAFSAWPHRHQDCAMQVHGIALVNLQSYAGGVNPWGPRRRHDSRLRYRTQRRANIPSVHRPAAPLLGGVPTVGSGAGESARATPCYHRDTVGAYVCDRREGGSVLMSSVAASARWYRGTRLSTMLPQLQARGAE
jgi:hypothetical protein